MDDHCEWTVGVVGWTACPCDCTCCVGGVAARPRSKFDLHGCLWILICIGRGRRENSDDISSNRPCNLRGGPFYRVCNELSLIVGRRIERSSVVGCDISFSEVIRLNLCTVCSQPLQINFIQVVRFQHQRANNSRTGCRLHCNLDLAKHDVEQARELGSVAGFGDCEGYAIRIVGRVSGGGEGVHGTFREVDADCLA